MKAIRRGAPIWYGSNIVPRSRCETGLGSSLTDEQRVLFALSSWALAFLVILALLLTGVGALSQRITAYAAAPVDGTSEQNTGSALTSGEGESVTMPDRISYAP